MFSHFSSKVLRGHSIRHLVYRLKSPRNVVMSIVGVNTAVFVSWQFPQLQNFLNRHFVCCSDDEQSQIHPLLRVKNKRHRLHTFLTSGFSHQSFDHLLMNMIPIMFCGPELVLISGPLRLLALYATSCVTGSVAHSIFDRRGPCIGASAATFGILTRWAFWFPRRMIYLNFIFPVPAAAFVLGYMLLELQRARKANRFPLVTGVAHSAHLGGFGVGLLFHFLRFRYGT